MNTNERTMRTRGLFGGALFVAGMVALAGAEAATADVIYDTFGPNDEYNSSSAWLNGDNLFGHDSWNAMPFELGAGTFTNIHITVPMTWQNSSNPTFFSFQLKIYADDGTNQDFDGNPVDGGPGTLIESLNLSAGLDLPERVGDGPYPLSTFEFEDAVLQGNTKYWLALETEQPPDGQIWWHLNAIGHEDFIAQRTENLNGDFPELWTISSVDNPTGAMRIEATNIPAPGVAVLLGLGLITSRRRRR